MANETLNYCDLGPALIGTEKFEELNRSQGGVGGGSDLGPAFLSAEDKEQSGPAALDVETLDVWPYKALQGFAKERGLPYNMVKKDDLIASLREYEAERAR